MKTEKSEYDVEDDADLQRSCRRCGSCCQAGGPALHRQDLGLVREGMLPRSSLITVRRGELVHHPLAGGVRAARVELVKIAGSGRQWTCRYFQDGCTIYPHRPLACRALKCWDTEEVLALMERETLIRLDLIPGDHPMVPAIGEQEREFPCDVLEPIFTASGQPDEASRAELEDRANRELLWRSRLVARHSLSLGEELFFFGRPYFQLLQALGFAVSQGSSRLSLSWRGRGAAAR